MRNFINKTARVIGVISDTHGLLRAEAVNAMRGVDLILHAGDIGSREVLDKLKSIAPVVAIRGNNDNKEWAERLPDSCVLKLGSAQIYMLHNLKEIELNPPTSNIRVVISGHSHKPCVEVRDGVTYLNPGSAGPRRFKLPVSVGRLEFIESLSGYANCEVRAKVIELCV